MQPTQLPVQWKGGGGALFRVVKRPAHEADHSPPSMSEDKNVWIYTSTSPIRVHSMVLS